MPTRNINLTDRYDALVARQVNSGRFKNASEVVRAALYLLEREEMEEQAKLEGLRREAGAGEEDYNQGKTTLIENDAALDQLFSDIAREADGT